MQQIVLLVYTIMTFKYLMTAAMCNNNQISTSFKGSLVLHGHTFTVCETDLAQIQKCFNYSPVGKVERADFFFN